MKLQKYIWPADCIAGIYFRFPLSSLKFYFYKKAKSDYFFISEIKIYWAQNFWNGGIF